VVVHRVEEDVQALVEERCRRPPEIGAARRVPERLTKTDSGAAALNDGPRPGGPVEREGAAQWTPRDKLDVTFRHDLGRASQSLADDGTDVPGLPGRPEARNEFRIPAERIAKALAHRVAGLAGGARLLQLALGALDHPDRVSRRVLDRGPHLADDEASSFSHLGADRFKIRVGADELLDRNRFRHDTEAEPGGA
jgi:hypothetical protein